MGRNLMSKTMTFEIPAYCDCQDPIEFARRKTIFEAMQRDMYSSAQFAMMSQHRRAALLSKLATGLPLSVEQCLEFGPHNVPQLVNYHPRRPHTDTPEETAAKIAVQAEAAEANAAERVRRAAQPVQFKNYVEVCAYFGQNVDARDRYVEAHPEVLRSV